MKNSKQVLTKEQISIKVWESDSEVELNSVEFYVYYLRKKLDLKKCKVRISTVRGGRYCLKEIKYMFRKLRIKLTLFNLAVFGGILVIFTMIIFVGGNHKKENTDIQKMYLMASDKNIFEDSHYKHENKYNKHKTSSDPLENDKDMF